MTSWKSIAACLDIRKMPSGLKLLFTDPRELMKRLYATLRTDPDPIVVYSEVTAHCNNRCYFCGQNKINRAGCIKDEVRKRIVDMVSSHPDTRFKIYFHLLGEPLLYDRLEEYVRLLSKNPNAELWMSTNGAFLNDERLNKLREAGLKNVWFTMFYTNEADYKKNTRSDAYNKVKDNLFNLLAKSNLFERIHIVTFSEDANEIERLSRRKINVTLRKGRTSIPWKYKKGLKDKQICVSINGDITFHYKDYNFENSAGNILDMDSDTVLKKYNEC